MTAGGRIRTPWKHRWRRFRYSAMPVLCFLACVALTLWLWRGQRQTPNAVAVVEQTSIPIAASADGKIISLWENSEAECAIFDRVGKGQLIARLDDSLVRAQLLTSQKEVVRLYKDLDATREKLRMEAVGLQRARVRDHVNLIVQADRTHLDVLDRTTKIVADEILLQQLDARLQYNRPLLERKLISAFELKVIELECAEVQKRIVEGGQARIEAQAICDQARRRLEQYVQTDEVSSVKVLLGPISAQIETEESRIEELRLQAKTLSVFAPFSGVVCQIHYWPDQFVRCGDPIITLAATEAPGDKSQPLHAMAYIPQGQRIQLEHGMKVGVQSRAPGNPRAIGTVVQIGPQYESVPLQNLRDPTIPERGRPLRIKLPPEFDVVPGEAIDIRLSTRSNQS